MPATTSERAQPLAESPLHTYQRYLRGGLLAYQYSPSTRRPVFFPRVLCPVSGATDLEWRVSGGTGTVHATTVVFPREGLPYNVALIDVDEGFRMMSRVEGLAPEDVRIGLRVQVRVLPAEGDEPPIPVFDPLEDQA